MGNQGFWVVEECVLPDSGKYFSLTSIVFELWGENRKIYFERKKIVSTTL